MVRKKILIARCNYETDVLYPFYWAGVVKEEVLKRDFDLLPLENTNFVMEKFGKLVKTENPTFIFCSGHGDNGHCIKGHAGVDVVKACNNDILFSGKIVYALACDTISCLKESAMSKGCYCYIGFDGKFSFRYNKKNLENEDILNDEIAKAFMETSNSIPLTLLNKGNLDEVYKNFHDVSDRWIEHWGDKFLGIIHSNVPSDVIVSIIGYLRLNKNILRINYVKNENLLYSE